MEVTKLRNQMETTKWFPINFLYGTFHAKFLDIGVESLQSLLPKNDALEAVLCDSKSIKS